MTPEENASWPSDSIAGLSAERLNELTSLGSQERRALVDGISDLAPTLARACTSIIARWDELDGPERLIALLAFAEALAAENSPRSKQTGPL